MNIHKKSAARTNPFGLDTDQLGILEPAQRQAIADGAAEAVFELLKNHNAFDEEGLITGHVEMMLKLLEMMASQGKN